MRNNVVFLHMWDERQSLAMQRWHFRAIFLFTLCLDQCSFLCKRINVQIQALSAFATKLPHLLLQGSAFGSLSLSAASSDRSILRAVVVIVRRWCRTIHRRRFFFFHSGSGPDWLLVADRVGLGHIWHHLVLILRRRNICLRFGLCRSLTHHASLGLHLDLLLQTELLLVASFLKLIQKHLLLAQLLSLRRVHIRNHLRLFLEPTLLF
mmetsp:Transcript_12472/g.27485  ORF Transcript_12472/g.27485 Transcript_12472/m.27485 type:complete len:208 (+) Transcript_12472:2202-2825(+)